jgi:hypothetical protein
MHTIVILALLFQVTDTSTIRDSTFPSIDEVSRLQNRRAELANELGGLQIKQNQIAELLKTRRALDDAQMQLQEARRRKDTRSVAYLEDQVRYYNSLHPWSDANTTPILAAQLDTVTKDIEAKTAELRGVELKLSRSTNIALVLQDFKRIVSLGCAFLVAVVFIGFLAIAWRDEVVRRRVFDAGSSIQFLTLFLLIIAIILFGVTGILEGKELSALLGGLSGYILGRVSAGGNGREKKGREGKSSENTNPDTEERTAEKSA